MRDGRLVAASQEERFSRRRHDHRWPAGAIAHCLAAGGIGPGDLDLVAFYDKPLLKFERIVETYVGYAPRGIRSFLKAMPLWLQQKLWTPETIRRNLPGFDNEIVFAEHHESHAASAFFPSPFARAAVLTVDGVGEWTTTSIGVGEGAELRLCQEIHFPHSLGLLYSAFTYHTGFRVNSGEYKVMGLAPYGTPRYADLIFRELIDLRADGSFRLNLDYFDYCAGLTMTNDRFSALFDGPPRLPESTVGQREKDLAASVQAVCEEVMLRLGRQARAVSGCEDLCLAGGVALNCVSNGRLLREGPFSRIWIQPAAGDAGGAVGAAYVAWHRRLGRARPPPLDGDEMQGALLGPGFSDEELETFLRSRGLRYQSLGDGELAERVAALIAGGKVVGWFQGRMEFGPRSLGARSILADPRSEQMQATLNGKIKRRESFRPFAPAVIAERAGAWFDLDRASPYMSFTAAVKRRTLPAVTHVDGSARVQTVSRDGNPRFYDLLAAFERQTGCPVLVNTSFNVRGEPIVCTPDDAARCFLDANLDHLVLGRFLLDRPQAAS